MFPARRRRGHRVCEVRLSLASPLRGKPWALKALFAEGGQLVHEWRIPSSNGEHVRTPGSTRAYTRSLYGTLPPTKVLRWGNMNFASAILSGHFWYTNLPHSDPALPLPLQGPAPPRTPAAELRVWVQSGAFTKRRAVCTATLCMCGSYSDVYATAINHRITAWACSMECQGCYGGGVL